MYNWSVIRDLSASALLLAVVGDTSTVTMMMHGVLLDEAEEAQKKTAEEAEEKEQKDSNLEWKERKTQKREKGRGKGVSKEKRGN